MLYELQSSGLRRCLLHMPGQLSGAAGPTHVVLRGILLHMHVVDQDETCIAEALVLRGPIIDNTRCLCLSLAFGRLLSCHFAGAQPGRLMSCCGAAEVQAKRCGRADSCRVAAQPRMCAACARNNAPGTITNSTNKNSFVRASRVL